MDRVIQLPFVITLVVISWYIFTLICPGGKTIFCSGRGWKTRFNISQGRRRYKYEDCMKKNKMYVNLGYYTFPWNHIFVARKLAVKRALKGDASFPIHQHQGSNACHIMKHLRGRTIIIIIVFLGIKKISELNTSSKFLSYIILLLSLVV